MKQSGAILRRHSRPGQPGDRSYGTHLRMPLLILRRHQEEISECFEASATVLLLVGTLVAVAQTPKKLRDYVPDEKTAVRIADAVLSAQHGKETVKAQLPLHTSSSGDYWIVQLQGAGPATSKGGGPAVWINKH